MNNYKIDYKKVTLFTAIYLPIITVITIICIMIGTGAFVSNGAVRFFGIHLSPFGDSQIGGGKEVLTEEELNDSFDRIHVDISAGNLMIKEGDLSARYEGIKTFSPKIKVEDGVLKIVQDPETKKPFGKNGNIGNVTICIPAGKELKSIDGKLDFGDLNVEHVTAEKISVNMSAGDLVVKDAGMDELYADLSMGDMTLKDLTLGSATVSMSMGDLEAKGITFQTFNASMSMGDIDLDSAVSLLDASMDISTSMGEVEVNHNDTGNHYSRKGSSDLNLTLDNSMGDIEVRW